MEFRPPPKKKKKYGKMCFQEYLIYMHVYIYIFLQLNKLDLQKKIVVLYIHKKKKCIMYELRKKSHIDYLYLHIVVTFIIITTQIACEYEVKSFSFFSKQIKKKFRVLSQIFFKTVLHFYEQKRNMDILMQQVSQRKLKCYRSIRMCYCGVTKTSSQILIIYFKY